MQIIIIDDYEDIQYLLTTIVEQVLGNEHQVTCAANTQEAKKILEQKEIDLILTDFEYPDGGFPEMLPIFEKKNIPFILLSAEITNLKIYNDEIQIGTVIKDALLYHSIKSVLQQVKIQ